MKTDISPRSSTLNFLFLSQSLRLPIMFLQLNLTAAVEAVTHTDRVTHTHAYTHANKYHYATDGCMGWCFCRNSGGILEPDVWSCQGLVIGIGVSHIPGVHTHTHTLSSTLLLSFVHIHTDTQMSVI